MARFLAESDALPPTPFRVVCLRGVGQPNLVEGATYWVERVDRDAFALVHLREVPGEPFMLGRFGLPDEPAAVPPPPATDETDWRAWRDHGVEPGHCCCRIPRQQCRFHRD